MGVLIVRRYPVEAAHQLTRGVPAHHKCRRLHGHSYQVTLTIEGHLDEESGMLIEYDDLDRVVLPVIRLVDHQSLNTLSERCSTSMAALVSENPTVERLAAWLGTRLAGLVASAAGGRILRLREVAAQEDEFSAARWEWER
jgi:6-pyruvoyltetrahydropterin/6-carboxytetrahydropterin synthase